MSHTPEQARAYQEALKEQIVHPNQAGPAPRNVLKNHNVLITGGNSGLGAAMAVAFAEAGCTVTAADINISQPDEGIAKAQAAGGKIQLVQCDVTSWESQKSAFKQAAEFGAEKKLNHVIANAGVPGPSILLPTDEGYKHPDEQSDPLEQANGIQVSLIGCYYSAQLAAHYLHNPSEALPPPEKNTLPKASKISNSLTMTASLASYTAIPQRGDYCAAKFGVRGLFKSIRYSFLQAGIRTNIISPGYVMTPHLASRVGKVKDAGYKFAKVEDVIEAAILIATRKSMNGRSLCVGPEGVSDMRDDVEGNAGGEEMWEYIRKGYSTLDAP